MADLGQTPQEHFILWFKKPLETLAGDPDAGFAIVILALPLLERYLRNKKSIPPDNSLNDSFYVGLHEMFPILSDIQTAKEFWNTYRNGFLHQATFKTKMGATILNGGLNGDIASPIEAPSRGNFVVNPIVFASCVTDAIESDFATYEHGVGYDLPDVFELHGSPITQSFAPPPQAVVPSTSSLVTGVAPAARSQTIRNP